MNVGSWPPLIQPTLHARRVILLLIYRPQEVIDCLQSLDGRVNIL